MSQIIIGLIIGVVVGAMTFWIVKKFAKSDMEGEFSHLSQEALRKASEQFLMLAQEKMGSQSKESKTDLEGKKKEITSLIDEMRRELLESKKHLSESEEKRIASFSALKKELENSNQATGELKTSADNLKKLLSNNQLRGQFGEQQAEGLLKMAGFVIGQDYVFNKELDSVDTRPDFTVFMPDKTKINVDVKFPYQALQKISESESKTDREQYKKQFITDVKQKIKQVTTRDYINPEEKTVDFVILFIPNEMIFSYIYENMNEVWQEAMQKKVVLAGPFSFTAILRMVKQAYSNFKYQENLHSAISLIQKFEQEFEKYNGEFLKIGDKIDACKKQYDSVSTTRVNKLNKIVGQIQNEDIDLENDKKLID